MEDIADIKPIFLPCPPRIDIENAEAYRIRYRTMKIFQGLCPPMLRLVHIRPSLGKGKYKCGWSIEYMYSEAFKPLTDNQLWNELQRRTPHGSKIVRKRRDNSSNTLMVEYGIPNCVHPVW